MHPPNLLTIRITESHNHCAHPAVNASFAIRFFLFAKLDAFLTY